MNVLHPSPIPFEKNDILAEARRVLDNESQAISFLSTSLNGEFLGAVEAIFSLPGRLIVSGIGKSGHIAKKIAATLSSTGQPAYFVHATEANHGDLGMITQEDGLLILSSSGETEELHGMLAYARRFALPILAITKNPKSALGKCADRILILPDVEEACSLKLAPTTSTTMMLALGDALALCLLKKRGFTRTDYGLFHPGGSLGQQLTTVLDKMHKGRELPLIGINLSLQEVAHEITHKGFGCVGVMDEGNKLIGMITDGDLRRFMMTHLSMEGCCAKDVMKPSPTTVKESTLMADALRMLQEKSITSLFIVDEGHHPIGLIHIHDFLKNGVL